MMHLLPDEERLVAESGLAARQLYGNGPMCCSEAVLAVINREFDGGLSTDLVTALAKGFCGGIGDAGCLCGALSGAVMAQSLILGKDSGNVSDDQVRKASKELHDRFLARYGSVCCRVLSRERDPNSDSKGVCLDYVEAAAGMCVRLLLESSERRDGEAIHGRRAEGTCGSGLKPAIM
ncbi:C-GCAxxG-C-C family protein [Desulfovibrio sp. Fe33]|uniref:C-GCAxxG-C-C family protein n=1 Tax=Desulfovibrio sp. Fe33 TaxID=3020842 RepID=UPI00234CD481|nr:C-GCAxxG-C-C family protein [Desulfovibrio sp. Fe33]